MNASKQCVSAGQVCSACEWQYAQISCLKVADVHSIRLSPCSFQVPSAPTNDCARCVACLGKQCASARQVYRACKRQHVQMTALASFRQPLFSVLVLHRGHTHPTRTVFWFFFVTLSLVYARCFWVKFLSVHHVRGLCHQYRLINSVTAWVIQRRFPSADGLFEVLHTMLHAIALAV